MSQHQQAVIDYLQEENRILLEQLDGKPKHFTDAQRIRLARKAKLVGRRLLGKLATLVTPDTLRWFRVLVAKKWTFPRTNPLGRPSAAAMNSAECSTITTAKPCELPFSMVIRVFWVHGSWDLKDVKLQRGAESQRVSGGDGEIPPCPQDIGRNRRPLVQRQRYVCARQGLIGHAEKSVVPVERQSRPGQTDAGDGRV